MQGAFGDRRVEIWIGGDDLLVRRIAYFHGERLMVEEIRRHTTVDHEIADEVFDFVPPPPPTP